LAVAVISLGRVRDREIKARDKLVDAFVGVFSDTGSTPVASTNSVRLLDRRAASLSPEHAGLGREHFVLLSFINRAFRASAETS